MAAPFLLAVFVQLIWIVHVSTAPTTTQISVTVSDLVVTVLESAMDYQMQLSNDPDEWNVTAIVRILNETNPDLLYDPQQIQLIVDNVPQSVIQRLPVDILMLHGLCEYISIETAEYAECSGLNITLAPINFCVGPLIYTSLPHVIQNYDEIEEGFEGYVLSDCAPRCSVGELLYGLSSQQQTTVDYITLIGCALCLVLICFLIVNQCYDSRSMPVPLSKRPLLQHIPYFLTAASAINIVLMSLVSILGKETVLCQKNIPTSSDEAYILSTDAPLKGDKNAVCGIVGVIFITGNLALVSYAALFAFAICRTMVSPMEPLWGVRKRWWHVLVWCAVLPTVVVSVIQSNYVAVWPINVCFADGDVRRVLFPAHVLTCCGISFICLVITMMQLMKRIRHLQKSESEQQKIEVFRGLSMRLFVYACSVQCALFLTSASAIKFAGDVGGNFDDFLDTIKCQMSEALLTSPSETWTYDNSECGRSVSVHPFWFASWSLVCIFGVLAQTALVCHDRTRRRLREAMSGVVKFCSRVCAKSAPETCTSPQIPDDISAKPIKVKENVEFHRLSTSAGRTPDSSTQVNKERKRVMTASGTHNE